MEKFTDEQILEELSQGAPEWSALGDSITRAYQFADFLESMAFVNEVAEAAEAAAHHPDILIRWNKVSLTLSTHDAGGVTEKDFEMAKCTDAIANRYPSAAS